MHLKKVILLLTTILFLTGCSGGKTLDVFSFDARTKDIALENVVLISNGESIYVQPTYQLFWIKPLGSKELTPIKSAGFELYNEDKEIFYSQTISESHYDFLDTRQYPLEGDLAGTVFDYNGIEDGKKIYVRFSYEKDQIPVEEEIEVVLQRQ